MKNSIRRIFVIFSTLTVIFTYLLIAILCKFRVLTDENIFSVFSLVLIFGIIFLVIIFSNEIIKLVTVPLKRLEKNMKAMLDGKILDTKSIKNVIKVKEMDNFLDIYNSMMEIVKKNNFALNSQESKTEIILEHMADGVIAFSVMKDVIHMNKSAMALLGINNNFDTFDKIKKGLGLDLGFDQIMYLPNNKCIEQKIASGENILNLVFVPFYNETLTPMGIILIVRNITESTRLDNMRKEFVANVSHEFKTPLTSIKGYSETMMRADLTKDEIEEFARVINQEANRMDRLVVDLLQLSKFDYSKASMKKVNFSLSDLAKLVAEKMIFSAKQKEHVLTCEIVKPTKIYADKDSIEQVIMNIVSNSIKYTPDGGKINIKIDNYNNNAYISISDNGMGIPKNDLERIFERFYRVDKARSRKMGGTGLGLAIVKEIVDSNGGNIEIKSEIDKGTETIITIPMPNTNINN